MIDADALLREIGLAAPEGGEALTGDLADLAEALAYPLTMGTGQLTAEAAAQIGAENGLPIPAGMLGPLLNWGMSRAARGLMEAPDDEAWTYACGLMSSLARVKGWSPESVADGLYAVMAGGENLGLYATASAAQPADDVAAEPVGPAADNDR